MDEAKKDEGKKIKIIKPQEGGQMKFVCSNVDVCFFGGTLGGGKLLSINELVLTPTGWVKNGTLKKGDIVCTPFGKPTKILEVFPHKNKPIYELTTSDGRKCLCGLEHLWEVRTKKQLYKHKHHGENKDFCIVTTEHLIDAIKNGKKYYIPIPHAQEFSEKEYVIPPYILGILIGYGCLSTITDSTGGFSISNAEEDIIQKVNKLSDSDRIYRNSSNFTKTFYGVNSKEYNKYLKDVGLNVLSYQKFIPQEYLWGSIEQRKQLLFGLMDADGCVGKKNRYSFSTTSTKLKDDFVYLCRSLGYICTVRVDGRHSKYKSGVAYNISIQTDDIIFSSKKHIDRYNKNYELYIKNRKFGKTNSHVLIKSIEYKENEDALCIYVEDKDHLYIAGDWITTHNTFGSILATAEPTLDPNFKAIFIRKSLNDLKTAGSVVDSFTDAFGDIIRVKVSENPRMTFPQGSYVEARQVQNEDRKKIIEEWKGVQADLIAWEELTSYEWYTFKYIMSRARGKAKWTGKIRATLNPKKSHWVRKFMDWYIDPITGFPIPERDGVIRYFYLQGEEVEDLVWGDSKEEVYKKCRVDIDGKLEKLGSGARYESMIKSFTFYKGSLSENKALLENNEGYIGSVAATGGKTSKILIEGNWNIDEIDESNIPIPQHVAESVFNNDARINGDKWVTADLADTGDDNTVILVWNGLHIIDYKILCKSTPSLNVDWLLAKAEKHDIPNNHIIYDAIRAAYVKDYIPDAMEFKSYHRSLGLYGRMYVNLKDVCYARLVEVIKREMLSFEDSIADADYTHLKIRNPFPIKTEFIEECSVVMFKEQPGGKKTLLNKKEMNKTLGKGRSMDLLDPIAMRMYPLLEYQYGKELIETEVQSEEKKELGTFSVNIYNEDTWC